MGTTATGPFERTDLFFEVVSRGVLPREREARSALAHLAPRPGETLLEIGFGKGRLLAQLAARVQHGFVAGIEPSEWMQRHARIRCRRWIESGRVRLEPGTSADLGAFSDLRFDGVVGVHVVPFWEQAERDLCEIRRVLRPGGRLVLGFRPGGWRNGARLDADRLERQLRACGYAQVRSLVEGDVPDGLVWTRAMH